MKTLWIEDEEALNVGRVIVTKTGAKDCTVCYSCDEIDNYENRLKADMVAMLEKIQLEIEELDPFGDEWSDSLDACNDIIQHKIDALNTKVESEDNE